MVIEVAVVEYHEFIEDTSKTSWCFKKKKEKEKSEASTRQIQPDALATTT